MAEKVQKLGPKEIFLNWAVSMVMGSFILGFLAYLSSGTWTNVGVLSIFFIVGMMASCICSGISIVLIIITNHFMKPVPGYFVNFVVILSVIGVVNGLTLPFVFDENPGSALVVLIYLTPSLVLYRYQYKKLNNAVD